MYTTKKISIKRTHKTPEIGGRPTLTGLQVLKQSAAKVPSNTSKNYKFKKL